MMSGNPTWWNGMHVQISPSQFVYPSYNTSGFNPSLPSNPSHLQPEQDFPIRSWSQLLLQGDVVGGEEERFGGTLFQQQKKIQNWEDQVMNLNTATSLTNEDEVKQVIPQSTTNYGHDELSIHANRDSNSWVANPSHHHLMPVSSPISTSTTYLTSNNILSFADCTKATSRVGERKRNREQLQDHSYECDGIGIGIGGAFKKARVQQFSPQPVLKVRKEKLMDRITSLHQLVSPFGKTDTASVLSAATGCIKLLHAQIQALSSPYMRNASGNSSTEHRQHFVHGRNFLFQEEPGQDSQELGVVNDKDLISRGLCLVPISYTQHVGSDSGADYWASAAALGGGF